MSKAIIVKMIKEQAAARGFDWDKAENHTQRYAVLMAYRAEKNKILHSGDHDTLFTPIVTSQLQDWFSDLYELILEEQQKEQK